MAVLDGASDRPDGGQKTPLEAASTPNLDTLVRRGALGSMYTVGKGIAPESDAGVFSLLGYDPLQVHLSRGVVESIGAGVEFHDGDLALRAGFATVDGDKLVIRPERHDGWFHFGWSSHGNAHFMVTVPQLIGATIAGSGDIT